MPDELTTLITFMVPPADWELGDRVLMFLGFAWAGADRAEGEAVIGRLRAACPPDVAVVDPTRWVTFQSAFDAAMPKGVRAYWRNASFDRIDDPMIDTLVEHCGAQTRFGTAADLHHMGGAFGRVAEDATAFPEPVGRVLAQHLRLLAGRRRRCRADRLGQGVLGRGAPVTPWPASTSTSSGTTTTDAQGKALAAYGPAKLDRLMALKRRYDPENLFRINHNIPPAT